MIPDIGGGMGGGFDPAMSGGGFGDPAMFFQPEGINDLDPQLPGGQNPLQIGSVRRRSASLGRGLVKVEV